MSNQTLNPTASQKQLWLVQECPQARLKTLDKTHLSNAEMLAMIIAGPGQLNSVEIARSILASVDGNLQGLASLSLSQLKKIPDVGEARATRILAAFELSRRRSDIGEIRKISGSQDVYNYIKPSLVDQPIEHFYVLLLNRANRIIKSIHISKGGVSGTLVDPKIVFAKALEHLASGIILIHNHPSGNLKPSEADIKLTRKLKSCGETLEIAILDHVIFSNHGYYSFADEGIL